MRAARSAAKSEVPAGLHSPHRAFAGETYPASHPTRTSKNDGPELRTCVIMAYILVITWYEEVKYED